MCTKPEIGSFRSVPVSDFDTESEFDTMSVRSLRSSEVQVRLAARDVTSCCINFVMQCVWLQHMTEEELQRMIRKQQRDAKRRQREQELRRLHMAQEIQR